MISSYTSSDGKIQQQITITTLTEQYAADNQFPKLARICEEQQQIITATKITTTRDTIIFNVEKPSQCEK
jgi:hypothetical protein